MKKTIEVCNICGRTTCDGEEYKTPLIRFHEENKREILCKKHPEVTEDSYIKDQFLYDVWKDGGSYHIYIFPIYWSGKEIDKMDRILREYRDKKEDASFKRAVERVGIEAVIVKIIDHMDNEELKEFGKKARKLYPDKKYDNYYKHEYSSKKISLVEALKEAKEYLNLK